MSEIYRKNENSSLDEQFASSSNYGKVKLGSDCIFFRQGLKWNYISLENATRIFRRVEPVNTKMCCGNVNFDRQFLVVVTGDGEETEMLIGEGNVREAEALFEKLQSLHPDIRYGKNDAQ